MGMDARNLRPWDARGGFESTGEQSAGSRLRPVAEATPGSHQVSRPRLGREFAGDFAGLPIPSTEEGDVERSNQ